jgi:hypothetical protein
MRQDAAEHWPVRRTKSGFVLYLSNYKLKRDQGAYVSSSVANKQFISGDDIQTRGCTHLTKFLDEAPPKRDSHTLMKYSREYIHTESDRTL